MLTRKAVSSLPIYLVFQLEVPLCVLEDHFLPKQWKIFGALLIRFQDHTMLVFCKLKHFGRRKCMLRVFFLFLWTTVTKTMEDGRSLVHMAPDNTMWSQHQPSTWQYLQLTYTDFERKHKTIVKKKITWQHLSHLFSLASSYNTTFLCATTTCSAIRK